MKNLFLHRYTLALLLTMALGLVGCRDAQEDVSGRDDNKEPAGTYLQMTVSVSGEGGLTRAGGPQGGEEGNGHEPGNPNESLVQNATLLLYRDADGINSSANPRIEFALYAPEMYKEERTEGGKTVLYYNSDVLHYDAPMPQGTYHAIVLVNMGCRTDLEGKTLSQVRDTQVKNPYTLAYNDKDKPAADISTASGFIMTSAEDASVVINGEGSINNPKHVQVKVERLAARIDFSPGPLATTLPADASAAAWVENEEVTVEEAGSTTTKNLTGYMYVVRNASTKAATKDRFILTDVTPFNCLNTGTYLIKRVMNTLGSGAKELKYLGDELTDTDGNGINYVMDPWTGLKDQATTITGLGYRNPLNSSSLTLDKERLWPVKHTDMFTVEKERLDYYILDYTQENTIPPGHGKEQYATGLQFSGYYGHWDDATGTMTYKPQTYHYYIRHADPNGSSNEALPMKYGIVRNNIYRIHVGSVNSLGEIQIVVSEWNRIEVPEIQI